MRAILPAMLVMMVLMACGPTITVIDYDPIQNIGTEKIALVQTQNAILGTVGQHHDGVLAIPQYSWVVGSNLSATYPVVVTDMVRNEMSMVGYDVINMTTTMLTSSMEEGLSLSVGATIVEMEVHTYGTLCGNKSNAQVALRFDVTDLDTGTLIYTETYEGTASAPGSSDPISGITMAAQNATRAFLSSDMAASTLAGNF